MSKKRIRATLYMESKVKMKPFSVEHDPSGFLFAQGKYRTKILPADLPEYFVYGYIYKRHGYISAKDIKHILYIPNYTLENHLHKYDMLYISYESKIEPYQTEMEFTLYKGYDHVMDGSLIVEFVNAVEKYSDCSVCDIKQELKRKQAWYYERNS